MFIFFDSSAFVKRYVNEIGTENILALCDKATEIGLSGIALPEIISAFCRLRREGKIVDTQYRQLKSLLLADIEDAVICDLTPVVLAKAVACLEDNTLRGILYLRINGRLMLLLVLG
jgi:predicted nucleic acid-binding protein